MIVLLAHGSPDPRHDHGVQVLAAHVGALLAPTPVAVAYLQHHGPTLGEAVAHYGHDAVDAPVWVLPLLLSGGVHVRDDVPQLFAEALADRGDLEWRLLPTLPPQTLALAVLESLGNQANAETVNGGAHVVAAASRGSTGVVGVVAGTSVRGALDGFEALASSLRLTGVEMVLANGPNEVELARTLLSDLGHSEGYLVPLMFADGFLAELAAQRGLAEGLTPTRPIGERIESAHALASWAAAHVKRATSAPVSAERERVDAAP